MLSECYRFETRSSRPFVNGVGVIRDSVYYGVQHSRQYDCFGLLHTTTTLLMYVCVCDPEEKEPRTQFM